MSFIITGAGGQLGKEWKEYLKNQGENVIALSSRELDITDKQGMAEILNRHSPDFLINCAAYTDVEGAEDDLENALKVNRDGVKNLAYWCGENEVPMVHFSTDYVFPGKKQDLIRYPAGYPEDASTDPVNSYGKSKLAGEQVLLESGTDYLLIRVSWLCGRFGDNFVTKMLKLAEERDELQVVNDQLGSPSFAGAVVFYTYRLLTEGHRGIFHISSKGTLSWFDFAAEIFRQTRITTKLVPVNSSEFKSKAVRPAFSKLSNTKICSTLHVNMEPWQEGLAELINHLK